MTPSFATSLDALGGWRAALGERAEALARFLDEHDLAHGEVVLGEKARERLRPFAQRGAPAAEGVETGGE